MEKKPKPIKTFYSPDQIREIEQEIKDLKRMREGEETGHMNSGTVGYFKDVIRDKPEIDREIITKENLLRRHTPQKATGTEANKLYETAKKCEEWIKDNMPKESEVRYEYPKGCGTALHNNDHDSAIKKQIQFQLKGSRVVDAYRYCMARLDPGNTSAQNIERLRRR